MKKRKNPFKLSFITLAIISCVTLCVVFLSINYMSSRQMQRKYDYQKMEIILDDWESQLEMFEKAALKISISKEYQPYYFRRNKFDEKLLLDDFKRYSEYSVLTENVFLYYGGETLFCSSGNSTQICVFLNKFKEQDRENIKSELFRSKKITEIIPIDDRIYIAIPFKIIGIDEVEKKTAIMIFEIEKDILKKRFEIICGGINGSLALYKGDTLIFSNQGDKSIEKTKDSLVITKPHLDYRLQYDSERSTFDNNIITPIQFCLIVVNILALMIIADLLAIKINKPFMVLSDKFREEMAIGDTDECNNYIEEIKYIFEDMFQRNKLTTEQIEELQDILDKQVLQMLISGTNHINLINYIDKLQEILPGAYYYVICIELKKKEMVSKNTFFNICKHIESFTDSKSGVCVQGVSNFEERCLFFICSLSKKEKEIELTDKICKWITNYEVSLEYGIGNVYMNLANIHASWLEGMDQIYEKKHLQNDVETKVPFTYDSQEIKKIYIAMTKGDEKSAIGVFDSYVEQLYRREISKLMQQYIFTDFFGEIIRLAEKFHVNLSRQDISLIVATSNIDDFKETGVKLIKEFCEKILIIKDQNENEKDQCIYDYMNKHFAEYDLSLQKMASDLKVSAATVRQAIFKYTGKTYKDYLIFLRIESAKKLLSDYKLSIADIAIMVGYGNISYFIKVFKDMNGITPAKYRELVDIKSIESEEI